AAEDAAYQKRLPNQLSDASPVHPLRLAHEINEFLTEDSIYVCDGGDVVTFAGGVVQPKAPGHWMDPGPLGTIGAGVPLVMVDKHDITMKKVVVLFEDGSSAITGFDFDTLVRFDLQFNGVIGNNSSMNQIRYGQEVKYGHDRGRVGNTLTDIPYSEFTKM